MIYTLLLSLVTSTFALPTPERPHLAPIKRGLTPSDSIPNNYIVSFKPNSVKNVTSWLDKVYTEAGVTPLSQDEKDAKALKLDWLGFYDGFGGELDQESLGILRAREEVDFIQEDLKVVPETVLTQANAGWALARLSMDSNRLGAPVRETELRFPHVFDDQFLGQGVDLYIVDSGVNAQHRDFGARASMFDAIVENEANTDLGGHGTHVAGLAGGSVLGIAKAANVIGVKVLPTSGGSLTTLLEGLARVLRDHQAKGPNAPRAVVNMSLSSTGNDPLDTACRSLVEAGIVVVVAAGNDSGPAAERSPARSPDVITVGASDFEDFRASFSNFGPEVDVYAPGRQMMSAQFDNVEGIVPADGTSSASPLIAGLAATLLSNPQHANKTPAQIKDEILRLAKPVIKDSPPNTTNLLAFTGNNSA